MDPLDLALDALPLQLPANVPDLSRYVHIILLSSSGVIFKPTDSILSILGISTPDIDKLLRSLHSLTVTSLHTITALRRKLERNPTTFSHLRHSHNPHVQQALSPPDPP